MMLDSFKIPADGYHVINFSGGRSSAYMLHWILLANNGLPENVSVVFCNTGKEHELTLDFVRDCADNMGVGIVWLEYWFNQDANGGMRDPKHCHKVVDHASASRAGEPFEQLIDAKQYLPHVVSRICTAELKVSTLARYMRRDVGITDYCNHLGVRYDEPKRWGRILHRDCNVLLPLVYAKATKYDVIEFWRKQPYDLKMKADLYGNCDLCFMKGKQKIINALRVEPERAQWWIEQENKVYKYRGHKIAQKYNAWFRKDYSYSDLLELSKQAAEQPDLHEQALMCYCGD